MHREGNIDRQALCSAALALGLCVTACVHGLLGQTAGL